MVFSKVVCLTTEVVTTMLLRESKSPADDWGGFGEAIRSSRPPPPFHESVLETTAAGDLTWVSLIVWSLIVS